MEQKFSFTVQNHIMLTSLATARFGSTTLPSIEWGLAAMAASTSAIDEKVTKPNPLDLLLAGSLITFKTKGETLAFNLSNYLCFELGIRIAFYNEHEF